MTTPTLETPTATPARLSPDLKVIDATSGALLQQAENLNPIATRDEYSVIDTLIGKVAAARKAIAAHIEEVFGKHIANAYKAHKDLCDDKKKYLEQHDKPLAELLTKASTLMRTFEQEEAARVQKAKDDAEAKRKEEEKAAAAKADAERKAQLAKDEEERLAKASALEAEGKTAEAETVLSAPPPPPPPPAPPAPPVQSYYSAPLPLKASNSGTRKNWTWKPKGDARAALLELVKAAAANPDAFLDFLTLNDKTLKDRAKSQEAQARVPGIEFYNDPINSNRARA